LKRLLVVGATGDVGQGIVAAALDAGWRVVAAARDAGKLARLAAAHAGGNLATVRGDLGDEDSAQALWSGAAACFGGVEAVVVTVNAPNIARPLLDWSPAELRAVLDHNLFTHFIAAKTFIPRLPQDGVFIGIGGGTADFVIPKMGQLSMVQAALRMMYRAIARERRGLGPTIRELMIVSMVNGESKRANADPAWVTDIEVGRHVCAILADPAAFEGPVTTLKSRDQVGQPDAAAASRTSA
jgi:NAD(P)-dependent dehydrogenase (short-subunit alcohol dehydrogenase family)